jgi:hypothetical protein
MSLRVEPLKLLSSLIKLDLRSLGLSNFFLEFVGFFSNFNGKLFDLEGKLLDLGLISSSVFLESEVILLLLSGSKSPLLKLFLVPVHLKFELIHLLISLEDHVLDVVQTILLVGDPVVELLDLIFQTSRLALCDLFHVFFGFDLLVLGIYQRLGMNQFHLH